MIGRRKDGDVSRLEAEGYLRVRSTVLPAAEAVLGTELEVLDEAIAFAEAGVARLRNNPDVLAAHVDRSTNELEVLRAVAQFRKALVRLAEGAAARARIMEG